MRETTLWMRGVAVAALVVVALVSLGVGYAYAGPIPAGCCRICHATDPCTGTVFTDTVCCPPGKKCRCIIAVDIQTGCYGGVAGVCL